MQPDQAVIRRIIDGVTIVLSVLLAFAIDAGWAELKERAEEEAALKSLYADFQANRELIRSVVSYHQRAAQSFLGLMNLTQDEILALPGEGVEEKLSYIANPRTFTAIRGSLDTLIHSGKLEILRDRDLREALITFTNELDDSVSDIYYLGQSGLMIGPGRRVPTGGRLSRDQS